MVPPQHPTPHHHRHTDLQLPKTELKKPTHFDCVFGCVPYFNFLPSVQLQCTPARWVAASKSEVRIVLQARSGNIYTAIRREENVINWETPSAVQQSHTPGLSDLVVDTPKCNQGGRGVRANKSRARLVFLSRADVTPEHVCLPGRLRRRGRALHELQLGGVAHHLGALPVQQADRVLRVPRIPVVEPPQSATLFCNAAL